MRHRIGKLLRRFGLTMWLVGSVIPLALASDDVLLKMTVAPNADFAAIGKVLRAHGATVTELLPEGVVMTRLPARGVRNVQRISGITGTRQILLPTATAYLSTAPRVLGVRRPTAAESAALAGKIEEVTAIAPNDLSRQRALLQGVAGELPAAVDNSVSNYFPPIGNQGGQGSCAAWATAYYYATYTHAMDMNLDAASGHADDLCSPAFIYNLENGGRDAGVVPTHCMLRFSEIGCCSLSEMPYDASDYLTWPSETAWVNAMSRRTKGLFTIRQREADFTLLKQHLANGNVGVSATPVYGNFFLYPFGTEGIDNDVYFAESGDYEGDHALTFVGYDDNKSYFDGVAMRQGAFLVANSWGAFCGAPNTAGQLGYIWIAYDYIAMTQGRFDSVDFTGERHCYQPRLYATVGLGHDQRLLLGLNGTVASGSDRPEWISHNVLQIETGVNRPLTPDRRIAVDLTDSLYTITDYSSMTLSVELSVGPATSQPGTIGDVFFHYDFDGNGIYSTIGSGDVPVVVAPGCHARAGVQFSADNLEVVPHGACFASFAQGGSGTVIPQSCTLRNVGTVPLTWTTSVSQPWMELSKTTGSLAAGATDAISISVNSLADALPMGKYCPAFYVTNDATGISHRRFLAVDVSRPNRFTFEGILASVEKNQPVPITINAVDESGQVDHGFHGTVTLSAHTSETRSLGNALLPWRHPLNAAYCQARVQSVCPAVEMSGEGSLRAIAFNVADLPGQPMTSYSIRMKHSPLKSYTDLAWETDGWTSVFQGDILLSVTGWNTFELPVPFEYNGLDSVMVDFSFDNDGFSKAGSIISSAFGEHRSIYGYLDGGLGSPVVWPATTPSMYVSGMRPDIRFAVARPLAVLPVTVGPLVNGTWSGEITMPQTGTCVAIVAQDVVGRTGTSQYFSVTDDSTVRDWAAYR